MKSDHEPFNLLRGTGKLFPIDDNKKGLNWASPEFLAIIILCVLLGLVFLIIVWKRVVP